MGSFMKLLTDLLKVISKDSDEESLKCVHTIDLIKFYQFSLIPATFVILLLAFTKQRSHLLPNFLNGRPGLVYPMDTVATCSTTSYCCAFGATAFLVYKILLDQQFAINYDGSVATETMLALVSMYIYGMVFLPIFLCLASHTAFSYALGSLYVWMMFSVYLCQVKECNYSWYERKVNIVRALPTLVCLGYLSLSFPIQCGIACRARKFFVSASVNPYNEELWEIKASYQGIHVRNLFSRPANQDKPTDGIKGKLDAILSMIYRRDRGFRYPTMFICVLFTGICVVYMVSVEFMTKFTTIIDQIIDNLNTTNSSDVWMNTTQNNQSIFEDWYNRIVTYHLRYTLKVPIVVAMTTAWAVTLLNVLHMMATFRTNLFAIYKGDYISIPRPSKGSAVSLCLGSIEFAGFQVAHIVWGYVIQSIFLFCVGATISIVVFLIINGIFEWMLLQVPQLCAFLVFLILLFFTQSLLVKYVFLQKPANYLLVSNRRLFFLYTFFMFFFNILIGFLSSTWRTTKAAALGTILVSRLDFSTFPRKFESMDPGFNSYCGYIQMYASHTNPVVNVFIRILASSKKSGTEDSKYEPEIIRKKTAARLNWHLVYTLLHNPSIRIYRRGFMESLTRAKIKGVKIPISDKPITDIDLVKAEQDFCETPLASLA